LCVSQLIPVKEVQGKWLSIIYTFSGNINPVFSQYKYVKSNLKVKIFTDLLEYRNIDLFGY
jgi:hypothetical protein